MTIRQHAQVIEGAVMALADDLDVPARELIALELLDRTKSYLRSHYLAQENSKEVK